MISHNKYSSIEYAIASVFDIIVFSSQTLRNPLAFKEDEFKQFAKVGIMVASLLSTIIGMVWLSMTSKKNS